jgi:hypothetical protein
MIEFPTHRRKAAIRKANKRKTARRNLVKKGKK